MTDGWFGIDLTVPLASQVASEATRSVNECQAQRSEQSHLQLFRFFQLAL